MTLSDEAIDSIIRRYNHHLKACACSGLATDEKVRIAAMRLALSDYWPARNDERLAQIAVSQLAEVMGVGHLTITWRDLIAMVVELKNNVSN